VYFVAIFALIAGPWLVLDPIGYLQLNKPVLDVVEKIFGVVRD
jgi:hypothetical protein